MKRLLKVLIGALAIATCPIWMVVLTVWIPCYMLGDLTVTLAEEEWTRGRSNQR